MAIYAGVDRYWMATKGIVQDGLVLNLDAGVSDSYNGGTNWYDLSGNGNNATLINGPNFINDNGGAIVFDGVNDKGTFTTPVSSSSPQTFEVWTNSIASESANAGYGYIIHNNSVNASVGNSYLVIGIKPTQQYYGAFNGSYLTMSTQVTANLSNIVQIVLTWDGLTQKIYINGDLKDSEDLTVTPQNFSTTTSFGDDKTTNYRAIKGNIYSIKTYSKALTPQEIQKNFQVNRSRFGI